MDLRTQRQSARVAAEPEIRAGRFSSGRWRAAEPDRADQRAWTFIVAIAAARQLLALHPGAGGFHLAPGAHAALPFDIISGDGRVVAESFAAVTPANNGKQRKDLDKLAR